MSGSTMQSCRGRKANAAPIVAIIQARMSSTRLPGKVLAELAGRPMVDFMIARLRRARRLHRIVVATSTEPSDDPLASVLAASGTDFVRGDLHDVLSRYCLAAKETNARTIVRVTADCPLIDPHLVDQVIESLSAHDYSSNIDPRTYPDGLDVEAFTADALMRANVNSLETTDREHVTPWMRRSASGLNRIGISSNYNLSHLRWTVDQLNDLQYVRRLVDKVDDPLAADRFDYLRAATEIGNPVLIRGAE